MDTSGRHRSRAALGRERDRWQSARSDVHCRPGDSQLAGHRRRARHGRRPSAALRDQIVVGCVGPVCAEAAAAEGLATRNAVVPRTWRLGPLARAVAERLVERTLTVDVDDRTVAIAGNLVTVGDASVVLTDTEAQVLTV